MGVRSLAASVGLLAVAAALSSPALAVLGGRSIAIRSAPWAISLRDDFGAGEVYHCSGVIIDPLHVVTAAHCFFNSSGLLARLSQLTVSAGVSNFRAPRPSDRPQLRTVAGLRFLRDYRWKGGDEPARQVATDLVVVRLARPLDLDGPDARAIALPAADARRPAGSSFVLAGFGREHADQESSGALHLMSSTVFRAPSCSSARTLCGLSLSSSACPGDSGAGLVTAGATPTLVGVLVTGGCARGESSGYVDLAARPILRFVEGAGGSPRPLKPRATRWVPAGWFSQQSFAARGRLFPVAVSLPRLWITGTTPDGVMNVWNPLTLAEANVSVSGNYASRADYFSAISAKGRAKYRLQDHRAVLRSRLLTLPAGPAFELIAQVATRSEGRRVFYTIENYNLFHDGVGYDVEYQGPPSKDGVDVPVWRRSARTIRFLATPAPAPVPRLIPTFGSPTWTPLPGWSPWAPQAGTTTAVTNAIAAHVAAQYRLDAAGRRLLSVSARPLLVPGSSSTSFAAVAIHPAGRAETLTVYSPAATWLFRLCGSGADCAIGGGAASEQRGQLVRREALELALSTFEYAPAVGAVIVELPPPPATGPQRTLLYFRRGELAAELRRRLTTTLPLARPPLPDQPDPGESRTIEALTLPNAYTFTVLPLNGDERALLLSPFAG